MLLGRALGAAQDYFCQPGWCGCLLLAAPAHPGWVLPPLLQAGTSLCNFLTLTANFSRLADGRHIGEVLLQFGSPAHLHAGSAGGACEPVADAEEAAASQLEWPALGGVRVLGWRAPAGAAQVELVQRKDSCQLEVASGLALKAAAATADAGGLHIDLSSLNLELKCGVGVRVRWAQAAAPSNGSGAAASA